jgi:ABC-type multidrug transport system fused ATPase/permease subunit
MKKSGSIQVLSHHSTRVNYQEVQRAHDEIVEKEGVDHGEMFKLLRNNKCDVAGGIIGSLFAGAVTPLTGYVLSRAFVLIASGHYHLVWHKSLVWCFIFLIVSFFNGFFVFIKLWKLETLGSVITCNMRKEIVEKYLNLHVAYFDIDENAPGALLTKLSIDTTQLNSIILTLVGDVLQTTGCTITGLVIGFIYDYRLTLISIGFIPFIVGAVVIAKDSVRTVTKKKDNRTDIEAGSMLSECVINTKTIFSFNFQKPAVDMYLSLLLSESSEYVTNSLWKGFFLGLGAFATYCCNATVFYAAKEFILRFSLGFDTFMYTCSTLMMMITGISVGLNGISDYPKAKRAFISVFKTMRTKSLIPPFLRDNEGKIVPENLKGKIEFRNVTFAYPTKPDIDVLKDVSFVIQPGQSAGLVGYSGCGKSTIIQLIERFYDVEDGSGEVLIDDINIKDYNLYLLRKRIGLVSQEPVLFKRSVYENILYGRLDATKEEVLAAAKAAVIEKFFDKKEMGTKEDPVSGGEKQRLAIARAFLKDPIILLLDEATSALDKESEKGVQASIDILQKGRTSVAVAHRLSTIQNSDVILVMENGKLVEKGTHEELVALGRKYANLLKYSEQ